MGRDSRNAASEVLPPLSADDNPGDASSVPETDSAGEAGLSLCCCVLNAVDPGSMLVMMNRKQVTVEPRPPSVIVVFIECGFSGERRK